MAIIVNIDVMLARRKMSVTELSEKLGITMANVSILKNGKAKAVRIETLNKLCEALDCQPGDLFAYEPDEPAEKEVGQQLQEKEGKDNGTTES